MTEHFLVPSDLWTELFTYIAARVDVRDGGDGRQLPNSAMTLYDRMEREAKVAEAKSPLSRSKAVLPTNIRKTLEESNLPAEVAVAIADEIDRLRAGWIEADRIALEARIRDAKKTRPEEEQYVEAGEFVDVADGLGTCIPDWTPEVRRQCHGGIKIYIKSRDAAGGESK